LFLRATFVFCIFTNSTNYITVSRTTLNLLHSTAALNKLLNHHGKDCKSETDSQHWHKDKKSTSRKTVCGKSNTNELPSSPRSRAGRAAHRGALLIPTDVDDPALSAVNPSVSEINYDFVSPGAARAQAKNAIEDNNFWDKTVDKGIDLAYNSDNSDDEDYRGGVYDDDYSDGEDFLAKTR